jgi:hypothetical protein
MILGNDRDDDFRFGGQGAGICRDPQSARSQRLVSVGSAIPAHDAETVLAQAVGHRRAHSTESNQADFHNVILIAATHGRTVCGTSRHAAVRYLTAFFAGIVCIVPMLSANCAATTE